MALHIEVQGEGPALVLIHGWALHGGVFAPLLERLSHRFRFHLVDLPGHGHSRDDATPLALRECVEEIAARTPPALWVGWSLGGLFALHAAAARPGQVRGLAMLASTPRFVRGDDWTHAVAPAVFRQFGDDLCQDYRGTLQRFLALDTLGAEHGRTELRSLQQALYARGEPSPRILQEGLRLLDETDLRAALPRLRMPSLWLSGHRDRLVPHAGMAAAAALAPAAQHLDIAGGGHAPFLGHADTVAAALAEFAERLPRAATLQPLPSPGSEREERTQREGEGA